MTSKVDNIQNATLMGLVAIVFWSSLPIISLFTKGVPPFLSLSIAFGFSSFLHMLYWQYKYGGIVKMLKQPISYITVSVYGIFGANATFLLAMQNGDPIASYLVLNMWPIFALFFAALLFREKLNSFHYIGAILGFIGVIFISSKDGITEMEGAKVFGILLAFMNAVIWASFSVLTRKYKEVPADAIGLPLAIAAILTYITHLLFEPNAEVSFNNVMALLYLGLAPWGVAYTIWGYALRFGDVKALMIFGYFMPLLGMLWMILLGYGEFNIGVGIATLLIVGGAALGSVSVFFQGKKLSDADLAVDVVNQ